MEAMMHLVWLSVYARMLRKGTYTKPKRNMPETDNFRLKDMDKVLMTGRGRQTRAKSRTVLIAASASKNTV